MFRGEDAPDVDQGSCAEYVVTPLVRARNQSTDEAVNNQDIGDEGRGHDVGERKTGGEQELEQQQRQGYEPLDVADILNDTSGQFPCRWRR